MTTTTDKQEHNAASKGDYRGTLNITLSDKDPGAFPQRGNLPGREPQFQQRWDAMDLYGMSLRKRAPLGTYVLHDGPPYSNGDIHLGHALNKVAKDIVTRYKTMLGYCAPYVPGWDNHGMPIENAVARRFREKKQAPDRVTLRQACREYAADWVKVQRDQFKRLGIRGDWEKPYLTMSSDFEAKIVEVFGELAAQGFIYRGLKPVFWCATDETALADAEVEYEPHTSNSIYVRFPLFHDPNGVFALPDAAQVTHGAAGPGVPAYAVIWTTTPWTIPANLAVAVHPDAEYAVVRARQNEETVYYLAAVPLVEATMQVAGVTQYEMVKTVHGSTLAGLVFRHPLFQRTSPVVLADYVTMDTGTGIVHTAPGHGKEDFETGIKYGLEVLNPVDNSGRYTAQAGGYDGQSFQGLRVTTVGDKKGQDAEANGVVIEALRKSGNLLSASRFEHSYPHCWRCHSPLIFRATVQWFMNIDHQVDGEPFRQRALKAIEEVGWHPKESINRITSMVANRPDWCVSRQRSWGVGIPAFYCNHCGEHILAPESVAAVAALVRNESSDAWYAKPVAEILPNGFQCPHCKSDVDQLRKETDVLDVWFDSGSTNRAVLEAGAIWPELHWPADLYLEGGDQHRGWFNSSLMIGVGTKGAAPYKAVVTNGWTLDENGEAFSKSKGNGVNPLDVVKNYGADVVRWWVVSQNFMEDTRCGDNLLKQVGEMYRRVRNTFRFLVNNLYDFDPATDAVPQAEMEELDRWALVQLAELVRTSTAAYESFEFHKVYQQVLNFCSVELSAFYLDVLKDRLYASGAKSRERRSAQTAMHTLAETMARLLAPILVHTAEEVWDHLKMPNKPESVHLADFPTVEDLPGEVPPFWEKLVQTRDLVKSALESSRQAGVIVNPLEACVVMDLDKTTYALFQPYEAQLPALFLVSQVRLSGNYDAEHGISVGASPAEGVKCARCWLIKTDVGVDPAFPDLCGRCANVLQDKRNG
jgi:isoleucyl-tRNA synthetase